MCSGVKQITKLQYSLFDWQTLEADGALILLSRPLFISAPFYGYLKLPQSYMEKPRTNRLPIFASSVCAIKVFLRHK